MKHPANLYRPLILLVSLTGLVAEAVYLPGNGPLPLRFQAQPGVKVELPPLFPPAPTNDPVTITNFVEVTNIVTVTITNVVGSSSNAVVNAVSEKSATTNSLLIAPLPEAQPMSPAALMQFFRNRNGTNQTGTAVVAPLGFAPPPIAPPSSTATFEKK